MTDKIYTYKTLPPRLIETQWKIYSGPIPPSREIRQWRKNADLPVECNIYVSALEVDSYIAENCRAAFYITWKSLNGRNGTSLQGCEYIQPYENAKKERTKSYNFSCVIPGEKIAGDIEVSLIFALSESNEKNNNSTLAVEKGAVLFQTTEILYLEGGQALFPVKAISFKERRNIAKKSLYFIKKKYLDLESNFNASYTLFFNTDHPLFKKINSSVEEDTAAKYFLKMIMFDVYRTIIYDALYNEHGLNEILTSFDEDSSSLRAVYSKILKEFRDEYFPEKDLEALKKMAVSTEDERNALYTAIQEYTFGED